MNFRKIAIFLALVGVSLGALGAHALSERLAAGGSESTWDTAALYQLVHALALFGLTNSVGGAASRNSRITCYCWGIGTILFSGSLYGLALTDWKFLGPVTPIGGGLLIAGWASLLFEKTQKV